MKNGLRFLRDDEMSYVDPHFIPGQTPGFMVFPIHRFQVSLPWSGDEEIDCDTKEEAIIEFNRRCGIRSTEHRHQVTQVF